MKRRFVPVMLLALLLLLTACGEYEPAGVPTGDETLDAQVLQVLQETCSKDASLTENISKVYSWVANEIKYRASTADTSAGYTDEVVNTLAAEMMAKRRGACDGEAALMAVFLRRMGCEAVVVEGQFSRQEGDWVDHAWVIAQVDGQYYHFDPLYGRYYAEDRIDSYCMAMDELLLNTHRWDQSAYPVCS